MAWTYNDWPSQSTTAAQVTRLKLHMEEVSEAIQADTSAGDRSRSSGNLVTYYQGLEARLKDLEARPDASGVVSGGISFARLRRG